MSLKKSHLVIWKTLRPFVNTFTAYDKYFILNREYFINPMHMQLSGKQKRISEFYSAFLKFKVNFKHIQKKRIHS